MKVTIRVLLLVLAGLILGSCESSGSGYSTHTTVGVSYYGGSGWYDPYYRRRCCYHPVRPPAHRPGRPVHLPARPARPSRPTTRPTTRPARRR
jgi:hypothetical protein